MVQCFFDFFCGFDVLLSGFGVAGGMVVYEYDGSGFDQDGGAYHVYDVDLYGVESAEADEFVTDLFVTFGEVDGVEVFFLLLAEF